MEPLKFMGFPWVLALEQNQESKWDLELEKYYALVLMCHHNVLYSDTLSGLHGEFFYCQ